VSRPPFDAKAARARCEAATPGEWAVGEPEACVNLDPDGPCVWAGDYLVADLRRGDPSDADPYDAADATFIAHARTDLPAALDQIEALQARLTAILAMLDAEDNDLARHHAEKARALA
jgi:hypothetical protein